MDKKNILEYYFGSKSKYALVVTMVISKKQRKAPNNSKKPLRFERNLPCMIIFMITNPLQQPIC